MNILLHVVTPGTVKTVDFSKHKPKGDLAKVTADSSWEDINRLLTWYETLGEDETGGQWKFVKEFVTGADGYLRCAEFSLMPGNYSCILIVNRKDSHEDA